jgi:hypothetical protein
MANPIQLPVDPVPVSDPDSLIAGFIRDFSKLAAGVVVAHGWANNSEATLWTGLLAGALSVAWSMYNKWRTTSFIAAASALPAGTPRAAIAAEVAKPAVPPILDIVARMTPEERAQLARLLAAPPPAAGGAP